MDTTLHKLFLIFLLCFFSILQKEVLSQVLYEDPKNKNIYQLLDELANEKIITINSCVKPYTKELIYNKLLIASKSIQINTRLKTDIKFYLKKYSLFTINQKKNKNTINKYLLSFCIKDSNSSIYVRPIWGIERSINKNGFYQHIYGGVSVDVILNKNWFFYANLRDNTMNHPIALPNYFSMQNGGNYKLWLENDYSEMKGGIIYKLNNGSISFIKENIEWGDNYFGSNILSGRTPSFPILKLHKIINKNIEVNFIHGWLISEDIDSSLSYFSTSGDYRAVFREKFIAANLISLNISRHSIISFGNSIIYSDLKGIHPSYLFPFFFYKSIDHSLNHNVENQNSQMFFNISCRDVKYLHLYSSLFIDEFQKNRLLIDTLNNFISYKIGFQISNWPIKNIFNNIEYNHTNPMTYQHTVEGTTFESNRYNLGHYLRDNSKVFNYQIKYKFGSRYQLNFKYLYAMHGDDLKYNFYSNFNPVTIPVHKNKTWDNKTISLELKKEIKENFYVTLKYTRSNIQGYADNEHSAEYYLNKFTPEFYHGKTNTISINLNLGF